MSIETTWARQVLEAALCGGHLSEAPASLTEQQAACFVTLHSPDGCLRGCIGTLLPANVNLAEEIKHNAVSAAARDPRFTPVQCEELAHLDIKVDVLSAPEPIASEEELDAKRYGVIVTGSGMRKGVLLPDLDGVETVAEQLEIARQKAGIRPGEPVSLERFTVERHTEDQP